MGVTCCDNVDKVYLEDPFLGISIEARLREKDYHRVYAHYYEPLSRSNFELELYNFLISWRNEVRHLSSPIDIAMNPNYQKIIGMGEKAVPFLLRELEHRPEHLFWALKAITGADPVQPHQRGRVREMAQAWLEWAAKNRYVW
jgi:hypothetical protein